jgi:hypothetical protein
MGGAIAEQHTANGRFSFVLAADKYFPSASGVWPQFNDGRCIAGQAVLRAHEDVNDAIRCYRRIR